MINQYLLSKLSEENKSKVLAAKGDRMVYIDSYHGLWLPNAKGYTADRDKAWTLSLREAYEHTKHCGPEKKIVFPYVVEIPVVEPLACEEKLMQSGVSSENLED